LKKVSDPFFVIMRAPKQAFFYLLCATSLALLLPGCGADEPAVSAAPPATETSAKTKADQEAITYEDDVTAKYWRLEGKSEEQIQARVDFLVKATEARSFKERLSDLEIREKYKDAIVIDALAVGLIGDHLMGMSEQVYEGLNGLAFNNGYTMFSTTVHTGAVSVGTYEETVSSMKRTQAYQAKQGRVQVRTLEDVYRAKVEGLEAYDFHIQGMSFIDDVDKLDELHSLGLNRANVVYNVRNQFGDGINFNMTDDDRGLTEMGRQAIRKMNELGIIVDCSHSSDKSCLDAIEVSSRPVILSHTNPRALMNVKRNAPDAIMRAIANNGGVVCSNMYGGFVNGEMTAGPEDVAELVHYTAELIGKENTCIGVDYTHNLRETIDFFVRNPDIYRPEEGYGVPLQMGIPADVWGVVRVLEEKYRWEEKEIRGFLGLNYLRVLAEIEHPLRAQ
jgi:microsomal dipeptidase-like Zn-dependent dipeptidase